MEEVTACLFGDLLLPSYLSGEAPGWVAACGGARGKTLLTSHVRVRLDWIIRCLQGQNVKDAKRLRCRFTSIELRVRVTRVESFKEVLIFFFPRAFVKCVCGSVLVCVLWPPRGSLRDPVVVRKERKRKKWKEMKRTGKDERVCFRFSRSVKIIRVKM